MNLFRAQMLLLIAGESSLDLALHGVEASDAVEVVEVDEVASFLFCMKGREDSPAANGLSGFEGFFPACVGKGFGPFGQVAIVVPD